MDHQPKLKYEEFLDTLGERCPMPVIHAQDKLARLPVGTILCIASDDIGVTVDFPAWCQSHKQEFISCEQQEHIYYCYIRKINKISF